MNKVLLKDLIDSTEGFKKTWPCKRQNTEIILYNINGETMREKFLDKTQDLEKYGDHYIIDIEVGINNNLRVFIEPTEKELKKFL